MFLPAMDVVVELTQASVAAAANMDEDPAMERAFGLRSKTRRFLRIREDS